MKKYLFLTLCLCIFLFPFIGNAKTISKAELEEEAESLIEYAHEMGATSDIAINIGETRITMDITHDGVTDTYEYEYTLSDENTIFTMITEVQNGMTSEEYDETTNSYLYTGAIFPHLMVCHLNGVSYDDAYAYYITLGELDTSIHLNHKYYQIDTTKEEVITNDNMMTIPSETYFSSHVTDIAEWMYSDYELKDTNDIYTYTGSVSTEEDTSTITFRMLYKNDAIYSVMDKENEKDYDIEFEDLPINFSNNKKTSPKTSTTVKVPNTALDINNLVYVLGLITILAGLLSVNKVIKRKSN